MIGPDAPTTEAGRFARTLAGFERRIADVERSFGRASGWTAVTFENSHANYGPPFQTVQMRKVGDDVQIRGLFKTGGVGTTVFTLPVGFRPPANLIFPAVSNNALGRIGVNATTGAVTLDVGSTAFTSINVRFSTV